MERKRNMKWNVGRYEGFIGSRVSQIRGTILGGPQNQDYNILGHIRETLVRGFRVWGLGLRVWGFGVWGLGLRVWGFGVLGIWGLGWLRQVLYYCSSMAILRVSLQVFVSVQMRFIGIRASPKLGCLLGGSDNKKDYCILGVYIGVHFFLRNYHSLPALGRSGGLCK